MSMDSGTGPRTPPRFVPTLTEVVQVPDGLLPAQPVAGPLAAEVPEQALVELPEPELGTQLGTQAGAPHRADALLWSEAPPLPPQSVPQAYARADAQGYALEPERVVPAQPGPSWPTPDLMEALGVLITEQVMQRLDQRLAVLVGEQAGRLAEQFARNLTEALSSQLRAEVPDLVQQAVALAVQPTEHGTAAAEHQRGFSPIYGADADSG